MVNAQPTGWTDQLLIRESFEYQIQFYSLLW